MKRLVLALGLCFALHGAVFVDGNAFTPLDFNDTAYGSANRTTNQCLDGTHPFFKLTNNRQILSLRQGNIAWSAFPTYYFLLKLEPLIAEIK